MKAKWQDITEKSKIKYTHPNIAQLIDIKIWED